MNKLKLPTYTKRLSDPIRSLLETIQSDGYKIKFIE